MEVRSQCHLIVEITQPKRTEIAPVSSSGDEVEARGGQQSEATSGGGHCASNQAGECLTWDRTGPGAPGLVHHTNMSPWLPVAGTPSRMSQVPAFPSLQNSTRDTVGAQ